MSAQERPASQSAWDTILDPGETILWQGRPDGSVQIAAGNMAMMFFGMAFAGFALFWMVMASLAGGFFWMFGLLHFAVGLAIMAGAVFWQPFMRRRTFYTLTDRRAFVARDLPLRGKTLDSYPITAETVVKWTEGPLDTLHFAETTKRGKNGRYTVPIGFERIADGEQVYRLLRQVQGSAGVDAPARAE